MGEHTLFETERRTTRAAAADRLRRLAAGLAAGDFTIEDGERTVRLSPPDDLDVEVEVEREDGRLELEVELGWQGEPVETASPDSDGDGVADTVEGVERVDLSAADGSDGGSASPGATFELYRDRADEWRWRLRHRNGNVIADSGEGYARKIDARNGIASVMGNAPGAPIEEQ